MQRCDMEGEVSVEQLPPRASSIYAPYAGDAEDPTVEVVEEEVPVFQRTIWEAISDDYEDVRLQFPQVTAAQAAWPSSTTIDIVPARTYVEREVYPALLPALEHALTEASSRKCLDNHKCIFNAVDSMAEYLWNKNPRHNRGKSWTNVFEIPAMKRCLQEHPRPYYPLSWLLRDDQAALIIQTAYRGFRIRRREDVQEMRRFWRALAAEEVAQSAEKKKGSQEALLVDNGSV